MTTVITSLIFEKEDGWINCYIVESDGEKTLISTMRAGAYETDFELAAAWECMMKAHMLRFLKLAYGEDASVNELEEYRKPKGH